MTRRLLLLLLATLCAPALAVDYTFPGNLPAGCSGSGGSYSCGSLTLANNDTITIAAPRPATITINGNFDVGRALVNAAGSAADLSVLVTGSLSVGNQGRVNGNVSAASFANPGGRAQIGGTLTTSGAISLGNAATVARCVHSTGGSIVLANGASTGGVCCGALGACTSSCVTLSGSGSMPALCSGSAPPPLPGRFNAFDSGTAAGSITGNIRTKVAGSAYTLAVVAINTAGTGVLTSYTGSVRVELLDSRDNSGALDATTGCRSSWVLATGTPGTTLSFAAADAGRKNVTLTVNDALRDARIRISHPASGTPSVVGCSTDAHAIRPASLAGLAATDDTWQTAGSTRTLANTASSGGAVHKAGQPFTLRAVAVNSAGATTTGYTGTPAALISPCAGAACGATLGALTLSPITSAGVVSATASYSEAGAFALQLQDTSFASVDASDGSSAAERHIVSPAISVGRFVPDHFALVSAITPVLRTFDSSSCAARSFTYLGQPFGYATAPQATVVARNAAGNPTLNYPDARLAALGITQAYTPSAGDTPGLDSSATTLPSITPLGNGSATLAAHASDRLTMLRPASAPLAPFDAAIALSWSVADHADAGPGQGSITSNAPLQMNNIAFDAGAQFRYGVLKLNSAYGSELIALAVPLELQHWNGSSFVTNAADQCTQLPLASLALANYRGNLAACETAPGSAGNITFTSGRGLLRMLPPGSGNAGSADLSLNLGAAASGQHCSAVGTAPTPATSAGLPWLQGRGPASALYDQNPAARISFGQYRSPVIHQREVY